MQSRQKIKVNSFRENSTSLYSPRVERIKAKKYTTINARNPKDNNFDKYYILPSLRYKNKNQNPKNNPECYQDQTFIYKNMHNSNFWNWVHPLDVFKLRKQKNMLSQKINVEVLQRFKCNLQNKTNKRVPILVEQLLKG